MVRFDCVSHPLSILFSKYGHFMGRHPLPFIIVPLLITGVALSGMAFLESTGDVEYLYTPDNSPSRIERELFREMFSTNDSTGLPLNRLIDLGQYARLIITGNKDGDNIYSEKALAEMLQLHDVITSLHMDVDGWPVSFDNLCVTWDGNCQENVIFMMLDYDAKNIHTLDLGYPITPQHIVTPQLNMKYTIPTKSSLSGVTLNERGYVKTIEAIQLFYYVKSKTPIDAYLGQKWEEKLLELIPQQKYKHIHVSWYTSQSLGKELEQNTERIVPRFIMAFSVIIMFSTLSLCMLDWVRSKPLLALCGVLSASLAIGTGIGLTLLAQVEFISIVAVMPILVLGIGVDDMYVMVAAWRHTDRRKPVPERMADTYSEAAVAITITSITDALSFGIGAITYFPSVKIFCIYTGVCIICDFIYQITFFGGCMVVFGRREEKGYHALTFKKPLAKSEAGEKSKLYKYLCTGGINEKNPDAPEDNEEHFGQVFFRDYFAPFLIKPITKAVVLILFCVYLGVAVWGCTQLKEGLKLDSLVVDDSYAVRFFQLEDKYFKFYGQDVWFVINEEIDYSKTDFHAELHGFMKHVEDSSYFFNESLADAWFFAFKEFTNDNNIEISSDNYLDVLKNVFLKLPPYSRYEMDLNFDEDKNKILTSRFTVAARDMEDANRQKNMMLSAREATQTVSMAMETFHAGYIYYDQYVVIVSNTFQNIIIATACMLVVSLIFIPQPVCSVWVALCIFSMEAGVIGYMTLWGVVLDAVAMINIIMCIGFCVDFSAHVTFAFVSAHGETANERITAALHELGYPVMQGALSTTFGVLALSTSEANVFRTFFKIMFLVSVLGFLHGLFVLPVVLSLVGPKAMAGDRTTGSKTTVGPSEKNDPNSDKAKEDANQSGETEGGINPAV